MIVGLNSSRITHALKTNPVICHDTIRSIEAKVQGNDIIITKAIVQEVFKFEDQQNHPTTLGRERVIKDLRRMSYEGDYPMVLKKLFPPYWRLLVHLSYYVFQRNKGGLDQLNQTQMSAMVAMVNNWDYNFSTFIFDNMRKMVENPKKKIFML
ncbi:hypothetical protein Hanom_Chr09g00797331 [Helianthus anomalus]